MRGGFNRGAVMVVPCSIPTPLLLVREEYAAGTHPTGWAFPKGLIDPG